MAAICSQNPCRAAGGPTSEFPVPLYLLASDSAVRSKRPRPTSAVMSRPKSCAPCISALRQQLSGRLPKGRPKRRAKGRCKYR